jgi:hypothetical protein
MASAVVNKLDHTAQSVGDTVNMLIISGSGHIRDGNIIAVSILDLNGSEESGLGWKCLILYCLAVFINKN